MIGKYKNYILLLLAAFIWGSAFIAQKSASVLNPVLFLASRYIIATFFLSPIALYRYKRQKAVESKMSWLKFGMICGAVLFLALLIQQIGIGLTSVGKAGFITSLYMVIIPIIYFLSGKKFNWPLIVSVILAVIGMFYISKIGSGNINHGDFVVLASSVLFAVHIIFVSHFTGKVDGFLLAFGQMLTGATLSWLVILLGIVQFDFSGVFLVLPSVLYPGIMSSGVAYTLAVLGLKGTNPIVASLILSLESVFAAISGVLFFKEWMNAQEIFGCILVFGAVIVAQFLDKKNRK